MNEEAVHILGWALAASGSVLAFVVTVWLKIEYRQDEKIEQLNTKLDENHHAIRDKLDVIWIHINKNPGD